MLSRVVDDGKVLSTFVTCSTIRRKETGLLCFGFSNHHSIFLVCPPAVRHEGTTNQRRKKKVKWRDWLMITIEEKIMMNELIPFPTHCLRNAGPGAVWPALPEDFKKKKKNRIPSKKKKKPKNLWGKFFGSLHFCHSYNISFDVVYTVTISKRRISVSTVGTIAGPE